MAWVSAKVYAILANSEEGKDIIERLPDMSDAECRKALDDFFGSHSDSESSEDGIGDDEISEALGDYQWQITDSTTVEEYASEIAEKLGTSKERVAKIIMSEAPEKITKDTKMSKVVWGDEEDNDSEITKSDESLIDYCVDNLDHHGDVGMLIKLMKAYREEYKNLAYKKEDSIKAFVLENYPEEFKSEGE